MDISRKIDRLGRIVLPMDFRKALGLGSEAEVVIALSGDSIVIKGKGEMCRLCGSSRTLAKINICSRCLAEIKGYKGEM